MFISKKIMKPVYITTFIDAIIFSYALKLIANSEGAAFIIAFASGKLFGLFLGDIIEEKLAIGVIEITIYKHMEDGIELADKLRELGYSVTTKKGYGVEGKPRLEIDIVTHRRDYYKLMEELKPEGKLNMVVRSVNKIEGKVGKRV